MKRYPLAALVAALSLVACDVPADIPEVTPDAAIVEQDVVRLEIVSQQVFDIHTPVALDTQGNLLVGDQVDFTRPTFDPNMNGVVDVQGRRWIPTGRRTADGIRIQRVVNAQGHDLQWVAIRGGILDAAGDRVLGSWMNEDGQTYTAAILEPRS